MTTADEEFDLLRRTLITLLVKREDIPVEGIFEMTLEQKVFLVTTCSAEMMVNAICIKAGFNTEEALKGFKDLSTDVVRNIVKRCKEVN